MKRYLMMLALVCLSAFPLMGQMEPKLGLILRSEQGSYSIHGEIRLTVVRENRGEQELLVARQWGWSVDRTNIRVFDASGREVRTEFVADELPPPPKPYDFILLGPGEFVGTRIGGPLKDFVNKPGDYEFVVEYTCYLPEQYAREVLKMPPHVPFWSRERNTVTSNRIKLRITE